MADCCNHFSFTDDGDSIESWQGLRGPYFVPHLSADGILSWTNTGNLPNPAPVHISGPPGPGVELRGPVASVADLPATAPSGELWLVGTASPYDGYFFNGASWESLGQIAIGPAGPAGADGEDGTTFTPSVSDAGVISWTNDGGEDNPDPVNIKGPAGPTGPQGPAVPLSDATPLMDGTASPGTGTSAAHEDHVHPHDTTKQDTLTFDAKPTANSSNPVTSGGIFANTTPSKVAYLDYSAGYLSFHLPAACRCLAVCLDSTAERNGLYAFCTTGAGWANCAKLSSTGPSITNGQNKVTFDFSFGGLTFLLFVPQGAGIDINEIYPVTN